MACQVRRAQEIASIDMTPVIAIELGFRYDVVAGTSTGAILASGRLVASKRKKCSGLTASSLLGFTPRLSISAPLRTFARIPSRPAPNPVGHESRRFEEPILQRCKPIRVNRGLTGYGHCLRNHICDRYCHDCISAIVESGSTAAHSSRHPEAHTLYAASVPRGCRTDVSLSNRSRWRVSKLRAEHVSRDLLARG
jgi:hypothetical protein